MIHDVLLKLGLSNNQIDVYISLLSVGTAPASSIARRLNIPRTTAKYTCQQLVNKGLIVDTNKNGGFIYTAKSPEYLHELVKKEHEQVSQKGIALDQIMGELKKLQNPQSILPKMRFYEGLDGLIEMFNDVLRDNKPINAVLCIPDDAHPKLMEYIEKEYIPKRINLKTKARSIFNNNPRTLEYRKLDKKMNRITLLADQKEFPFEINYHVYGNKVAFYSGKESDMTGVIIENDFIAQNQFSIFKMAWYYARQQPINLQYRNEEPYC
ncbi:hypothetical protein IPJ72_03335 [Candidatus Peregrinibacteria bacterium]|nr:MAG: hypothetical protein IPJ72_03335 [Candidatus Peregrinibacteria bacterium]